MRIGIDIMGGDFYPQAPVEGIARAVQTVDDGLDPVLFGDEKLIVSELKNQHLNPADFEIVHTDEFIEMGESPTKALQKKPGSSIHKGIEFLRNKKIDGFVSTGNTGAVVVGSMLGLGNIPGVMRPSIGVLCPTVTNVPGIVCDAGANIDCKPELLNQFAVLATVFMREMHQVDQPRSALINLGEEKTKGSKSVREAYELLEQNPAVNFVGNIEGRDVVLGKAEVLVCDGFVGNILIKFAESMYEALKPRFPDDPFIKAMSYEHYGGVPVLGVNGIVMIGHGISNGKSIESMIHRAAEAVRSQLVGKIAQAFAPVKG